MSLLMLLTDVVRKTVSDTTEDRKTKKQNTDD